MPFTVPYKFCEIFGGRFVNRPYGITPQSFSQKMTAPLSGELRNTQYCGKINYIIFLLDNLVETKFCKIDLVFRKTMCQRRSCIKILRAERHAVLRKNQLYNFSVRQSRRNEAVYRYRELKTRKYNGKITLCWLNRKALSSHEP